MPKFSLSWWSPQGSIKMWETENQFQLCRKIAGLKQKAGIPHENLAVVRDGALLACWCNGNHDLMYECFLEAQIKPPRNGCPEILDDVFCLLPINHGHKGPPKWHIFLVNRALVYCSTLKDRPRFEERE